jgi:hypothetical protein
MGLLHHLFVLFGRHPHTRLQRCFFWRTQLRKMADPQTIPQISFGSWFFSNPGMPVIEMPLAIMKYSSPSDHFRVSPVNFGIGG